MAKELERSSASSPLWGPPLVIQNGIVVEICNSTEKTVYCINGIFQSNAVSCTRFSADRSTIKHLCIRLVWRSKRLSGGVATKMMHLASTTITGGLNESFIANHEKYCGSPLLTPWWFHLSSLQRKLLQTCPSATPNPCYNAGAPIKLVNQFLEALFCSCFASRLQS